VLVVDDETSVRRLARAMVERCGFTVAEAADGAEALEAIRANPERFACVLLDLTMPRMSGEEALRELRRVNATLPVILSSGYPADGPVTGASGFIQKPYRLADLKDALRAAIGQSDAGAAPKS